MMDDVYTLENGEKVAVMFKFHIFEESDFVDFSVYAIPVEQLVYNTINKLTTPHAYFSQMPALSGINGYVKDKVQSNILTHFSDYHEDDLYSYELDEIHVAGHESKGIGSLLLQLAITEIMRTNADRKELFTQITHIVAEMVPDDEDRWEDLIRFYQTNGFNCEDDPFICCLFH